MRRRVRPLRRGDRGLERALRQRVLESLVEAALHQAYLRLYFVTLAFADSELSSLPERLDASTLRHSWPWQCADLFAERIAREGGSVTGALLVFDLAPESLHPHLHGLVLTGRPDLEVDQLWCTVARHCPVAAGLRRRVQPVTGSRACWLSALSDDHPVSSNVRDTVRYACKALPRGADLALVDRLVTSGPFAELHYSDERSCIVCGDPLPAPARRHRTTCSGACRTAYSRATSARKGQP